VDSEEGKLGNQILLARDNFGIPARKPHGMSVVMLLPPRLNSWCPPSPT